MCAEDMSSHYQFLIKKSKTSNENKMISSSQEINSLDTYILTIVVYLHIKK